MLIRFNVKNFLSFASRTDSNGNECSEEFSMISGKVRKKADHIFQKDSLKLLKFAAVYGANASGKSNLVKAMNFMQATIVKGLPKGHTSLFCKTDLNNKSKPSYFEMEILLDEKIYSYGFEVILSESRFISEWLVEPRFDGEPNILFERDIENKTHVIDSELKEGELGKILEIYAKDIDGDNSTLLLSSLNQGNKSIYNDFNEAAVLKNIFLWFKRTLRINYPNKPISNYSYLLNNKDNVNKICDLISAFGTGITGYEIIDLDYDSVIAGLNEKIPETAKSDIQGLFDSLLRKGNGSMLMRTNINSSLDFNIITNTDGKLKWQTVKFKHGNTAALFDLNEESDGTVRVLDLLEILISGENKIFVIDELDRCLHPSLTYRFVETFLEQNKDKNIQLIVTTHESRLMDFDLLRRDEIWFTNKKTNGETDIYSLEEYNERFDKKIDKAYLDGRYGGVPVFTTIFPIKEN